MRRAALAWLLLVILAAGAAWVVRGVYDELFLGEGTFHIVNATSVPMEVELEFPSGERRAGLVAAESALDVRVLDTGEGSVSVSVDGVERGRVGYVTSLNGRSVVTLTESDVLLTSPAD